MIQLDIKMPKSCVDCELVYDYCWCSITGSHMDWERCEIERLPNCPLKELNIDKIKEEIKECIWEDVVPSLDGTDETRIPLLTPSDVFKIINKYIGEDK